MTSHPHVPFRLDAATAGDGTLHLTLAGDLDWDTAEDLLRAARAHLAPEHRPADVHLDCSGLTLCDSTGLSTLLTLHRETATAGVRLHLEGRPEFFDRLLHLTGTYQHFTGAASPAEARPETDEDTGAPPLPRPR
ncbi:STAS domain-containing protein [Streptomyces sp. NPDC008121]|uniref:STAS domain-containing protein n=1 Tax=Streptomyces sp. NPDC008121 TaxID=3364809 RepID=UPI0036F131F8